MNVPKSGVAAARHEIAKLLVSLKGDIGALKRTQKALDQLHTTVTIQMVVLIAIAILCFRF